MSVRSRDNSTLDQNHKSVGYGKSYALVWPCVANGGWSCLKMGIGLMLRVKGRMGSQMVMYEAGWGRKHDGWFEHRRCTLLIVGYIYILDTGLVLRVKGRKGSQMVMYEAGWGRKHEGWFEHRRCTLPIIGYIYIYIGHWTGVEGQRKNGKPNGNVWSWMKKKAWWLVWA